LHRPASIQWQSTDNVVWFSLGCMGYNNNNFNQIKSNLFATKKQSETLKTKKQICRQDTKAVWNCTNRCPRI